jgi:23S rRNA (pseudouridine1915-N3)-methyltransferase
MRSVAHAPRRARKDDALLRIIVIGRCRDRRLAALADDYLARIRPLAPVEILELKDADPRREAADMVRRLGARDAARPVIALDERGEDLTTADLARLLGAHGSLAFLVGGADGLGDEARARADRTVRLSSLTLTHEMARVLLLEQVYRGLTILRGLPYHRA